MDQGHRLFRRVASDAAVDADDVHDSPLYRVLDPVLHRAFVVAKLHGEARLVAPVEEPVRQSELGVAQLKVTHGVTSL